MKNIESKKMSPANLWTILFALAVSLSNLFTIDMYLPSLPAIEKSLGVTQAIAQHTISFYILGMAISVLFFGPLSDVMGRKKLILFGLTLNIIGNIACFMATTPHALLLGRILQGIGAGATIGAVRAVFSDLTTGKEFAIIGSYFSSLMAISPIAAPVVGGYLQTYFNWQANFIVLGFYSMLLFIWGLYMPETNKHQHLHSFHYKSHFKNYGYLLTEPVFLTFTFCGGFSIAASMAYATSGPFILQNTLHLSPIAFGWMGIFVGAGNIAGKLITPTLIKRYDMEKTLALGLASILLAGILLSIALFIAKITLFVIIIAIMLSLFGQGISVSNAMALGVSPYRHMGGTANALWISIQMGLSFILSLFLSSFIFKTDQPAGLTSAYLLIGGLTLIAYLAFNIYRKPD